MGSPVTKTVSRKAPKPQRSRDWSTLIPMLRCDRRVKRWLHQTALTAAGNWSNAEGRSLCLAQRAPRTQADFEKKPAVVRAEPVDVHCSLPPQRQTAYPPTVSDVFRRNEKAPLVAALG